MNDPTTSATQLYLVIEAGAAAADQLAAALAAAAAACVLIVPPVDGTLDAAIAVPLIEHIQRQGDAAALLLDDATLARQIGADGVHLSPGPDCLKRYQDARDVLRGDAIVGAHAGKSRHDAMLLGEAAADYVAFGAPPNVRDRPAAHARRLELVSWWAEIFEIPCVAMDVETAQASAELTAAGADFIAVHLSGASSSAEITELVRSIHAASTGLNVRPQS